MLKVENMTKTYKDKIIFQNTNFKAESGEIVLLMGKSGIGKSTLLDIIAGIKRFDTGDYYYLNEKISPKDDEKMSAFRNKTIGYILQDFALIDEYTVMENIMLPSLYNSNVKRERIAERAKKLAEQFDLLEVINKKVKNISGGQKQRVAIIRSLILNPPIILADEPTTNLDLENFELVMKMFKSLKAEVKTIIIATHDERILDISDRTYKIENYQLVVWYRVECYKKLSVIF